MDEQQQAAWDSAETERQLALARDELQRKDRLIERLIAMIDKTFSYAMDDYRQ